MLIGKIHPGSGIGDQLFSYITTRVLALDRGLNFGFVGKEFFKGTFLDLDWGKDTDLEYHILKPAGKLLFIGKDFRLPLNTFEINKPYYDPEINFVEDGTVIDGYGAQDEKYWGHRLPEIQSWLKHKDKVMFDTEDNVCVINFRGGEFATVPELFLPHEYWNNAIKLLLEKYHGDIKFEVHTDDLVLAKEFFPIFPIYQNIQLNWEAVRYAHHLIISNSAFAVIPALLNSNVKEVIAPHYWARRNTKEWSLSSNYYRKFTYI